MIKENQTKTKDGDELLSLSRECFNSVLFSEPAKGVNSHRANTMMVYLAGQTSRDPEIEELKNEIGILKKEIESLSIATSAKWADFDR